MRLYTIRYTIYQKLNQLFHVYMYLKFNLFEGFTFAGCVFERPACLSRSPSFLLDVARRLAAVRPPQSVAVRLLPQSALLSPSPSVRPPQSVPCRSPPSSVRLLPQPALLTSSVLSPPLVACRRHPHDSPARRRFGSAPESRSGAELKSRARPSPAAGRVGSLAPPPLPPAPSVTNRVLCLAITDPETNNQGHIAQPTRDK